MIFIETGFIPLYSLSRYVGKQPAPVEDWWRDLQENMDRYTGHYKIINVENKVQHHKSINQS